MQINLQKYIASCGTCSRRKAEQLIKNNKITINKKIAQVTDKVNDGDVVKFNNKVIKPTNKKIYLMLNKPIGYTCTSKTFKKEKNIFSLIKNEKERLFSVGRLDKNSSGLLILTNDGDLTLKLTHPRYNHEKEYEITTDGKIKRESIEKLKRGVPIEDDNTNLTLKVSAKEIKKLDDHKISLIITEGKKRQIRKMIKAVGLKVVKLKRIKFSTLLLNDLPEGKYRHLTEKEIELLKK